MVRPNVFFSTGVQRYLADLDGRDAQWTQVPAQRQSTFEFSPFSRASCRKSRIKASCHGPSAGVLLPALDPSSRAMLTMRGAALAAVAVSLPYLAAALPASSVRSEDPCAKIAGKTYVPPADALACLKVFPFNETLRQNVISVVSTVFDFYTFEDYYLDSPPPFQESTKNIRAELSRINSTKYEVSFHPSAFDRCASDDVARQIMISIKIFTT